MSLDTITYIKVFPGIGTARVGNSPEYFIGPESPGSVPNLGENYKDSNGLLKPQASRFRVYGYDVNNNVVAEITHDPENGVSLEWDVHMRNLKAANYAFQGKFGFNPDQYRNPGVSPSVPGTDPNSRDSLIIDPGPKGISGLNQNNELAVQLDGGKIFSGIGTAEIPTSLIKKGVTGMTEVTYSEKEVSLGRLETDEAGRLIVVGGKGDAGCLIEPPIILQKGVNTFNDPKIKTTFQLLKEQPDTTVSQSPGTYSHNTIDNLTLPNLDQTRILLSGTEDGTGRIKVYDRLIVQINDKDVIYDHDFRNPKTQEIEPIEPIDLTSKLKNFLGKTISLTVKYVNQNDTMEGGTATYLTYINDNPSSNGNSYFNNPGWYDDTSGGSINASVTINGTTLTTISAIENEPTPEEKRGWVAVSPPKYVPTMNNVVSLLDLQLAMFPEQDPVSGTVNFALVDSNGLPNIVEGTSLKNLASLCGVETAGKGAPSITSYNGKEYAAYTSKTGANIIASSDDGGANWTECQLSHIASSDPSQFITNYAPSLCVFNGLLTYVIVDKNGYLVVGTSSDGISFTFNEVIAAPKAAPKATPIVVGGVAIASVSSPSAVAYNGGLYIAFTDVKGNLIIALQDAKTANLFTFTTLKSTTSTPLVMSYANTAPSIAVFFGELYYAYTGTDKKSYLGSYNNYSPAPSTISFNFNATGGSILTNMAPAIGTSHGKFYYAIIGDDAANDPYIYLATEKPGFKTQNVTFNKQIPAIGISSLAIENFSNISFYRDIYPILKTVTDYAWVNEPAFQGHAPGSMGDFLRDGSIAGYSNPNAKCNPYRTFVFQVIRPAEQLTPNVPPPPMAIPNPTNKAIKIPNPKTGTETIIPSSFPKPIVQSGRLMPHLFGEGGSDIENTFNGTNFPNQWLSLTPHQLWKIQEWVNGNFVTGTKPVENFPSTPIEKIPLAEQPAALNFGALEPTVGGGFHPGIELTYYMKEPGFFKEAFRFADAITHEEVIGNTTKKVEIQPITPGSVSGYMSIPWQGDFWSCNISWWAAMRPDIVVTMDQSLTPPKLDKKLWFRGLAVGIPDNADNISSYEGGYEHMVRYWSDLGYVVPTETTDDGMFVMDETERAPCLDDYTAACTPANKAAPIHLGVAQLQVPSTKISDKPFYKNSLNVVLPASGMILLSGNNEGTANVFAEGICDIEVNGVVVFSYNFRNNNGKDITPSAPLDLTYVLKPYVGKIISLSIKLTNPVSAEVGASDFWLYYPAKPVALDFIEPLSTVKANAEEGSTRAESVKEQVMLTTNSIEKAKLN